MSDDITITRHDAKLIRALLANFMACSSDLSRTGVGLPMGLLGSVCAMLDKKLADKECAHDYNFQYGNQQRSSACLMCGAGKK